MIGSPQCAFCGEDVYTRSGWRVGQDWFCSQSCFQKYEAWSSGRITNHNAAEYMGIKNFEHLYAIRDNFNSS